MGRVRFVSSQRDLERADLRSEPIVSDGSPVPMQVLRVVYETDAEAAQAATPRPLEASLHPEVQIDFAVVDAKRASQDAAELRFARCSLAVHYDESAGIYPLLLALDAGPMSEGFVALARERFGAPARAAEVDFAQESDRGSDELGSFMAHVVRRGIRFAAATGAVAERLSPRVDYEASYGFKAFPSCVAGKAFDQDPLLLRVDQESEWDDVLRLEGGIDLRDSAHDPVADLPMRRLVRLEFLAGRVSQTARVLRPVPGEWLQAFLPARYGRFENEGIEV